MVGRYELVRPLGRGGMAEVFLARRRGPGGVEKKLVVKRIRRERARDPRFLELFVQEARLSMSLAHKNIVPMFDFGRAGDELFLVMEFVDGVDLAAVFERARARGERMDPVVAAYVVMEACQALDYAHSSEPAIVHRDVTPRNVLLSRSGEVKLVDFGVATTETEVGAQRVRGTPAYMAPEQARGDAVDGRADVFSLGLVLYEALAGRRAYDAKDAAALLAQARAGAVPPLDDAGTPAPLRAIVARATAPLEERYPTARAMQLALDDYLVSARAAGADRTPPVVRLAAWLAELLPDAPTDPATDETLPAPGGPVATFLDDGLDGVVATLAAGDETARSVAETVADEPAGARTADSARPAGDAAQSAGGPASDGDSDAARSAREPAGDGAASAATTAATGATARGTAARSRPPAAWSAAVWGAVAVAAATAAGWYATGSSGTAARAPIAAAARADFAVDAGPIPAALPSSAAPPALDASATETALSPDAGAAGRHDAVDEPARTAGRPSRPPHARRRRDAATRARRERADAGAAAIGTVRISAAPWSRVAVVGRREGCDETPCALRLPAGRYTLRLYGNPGYADKQVSVTVTAGNDVVVRETLSPRR